MSRPVAVPALPPPEQMIRPRNIRGNVAGTWGHVMRPPGSDVLRRRYEEQQKSLGLEATAEKQTTKERERLNLAMEFEESTRNKMMHGQAEALAKDSLRAVHLDLLRRREALRKMLVEEGLQAETELSEQAARALVDRLQTARNQAALLKERTEQERLKVVEAARDKQDRERMEPLRVAERAALTLACKEVNTGQMKDKLEQREAAREEQRLHHALHLKTLQAQIAQEEEMAREELARKKALCETLRQQVEMQQQRADRQKEEQMAEGVRELNRIREELHRERLADMERRRLKREELQRQFAEQIRQRERVLAEEADKAAVLDEAAARTARAQIKEEVESTTKADTAAEIRMFVAHMKALRRQQELADLEEAKLREEQAEALRREQDDRRCRMEAARKRMQRDTLEGRRAQLEAAQARRTREAQEAAAEAQRLQRCREQNMQLASELQRRKADEQRRYASDLQQQIKYQQLLKERQAHEERMAKEQAQLEEVKYQGRVQELLRNPQKYATHPFRLKMEGKALSWPE